MIRDGAALFTSIPHRDAEKARVLPFVPGIRVAEGTELLFLSGLLAQPIGVSDAGAPTPPADIVAESESVFGQLGDLLEQAGANFAHLVRIQKFMTDLDEHGEVVQVMRRYFGSTFPTSTTVEVPRLVYRGFRLEVDAVAVIPAGGR